MNYKLVNIQDIHVVGMRATMTFETINMATSNLVRQFMPRRNNVSSRIGTHTFSIQNYNNFNFKTLTPQITFEKRIAVEVENISSIPKRMEVFTLKGGKYIVINYKGSAIDFGKLWQHIHAVWLPSTDYEIDDRAHFEKLPEGYNPMNSVNEEEVWIPVI